MKPVTSFLLANQYLVGLWILLCLLFVANECRAYFKAARGLSPQQAIDLMNHEHGLVIDLRAAEVFAKGHIIKAVNMKAQDLEQTLKQKKFLKKPVILISEKEAEAYALSVKFTQEHRPVFFLQNGLQDWQNAHLPLIKRSMKMATIKVYSKDHCPYCVRAKELLASKNAAFEEIRVDQDQEQLKIMLERSGRKTVPQIFINDRHIGGFDDLKALDDKGELAGLLNQ